MKIKHLILFLSFVVLFIFTSCSDTTKITENHIDKISCTSENVLINTEIKPQPYSGIKFIGHRGLSAVAPENTIPSFVAAGKYGMWGAECDIFETADGHFILSHDRTVDVMTNGSGEIKYQTLEHLKNFTVDSGNAVNLYPDLRLATLEEYLECCTKYNMIPVIEIKHISDASIGKLINILQKYNLEKTAILILNNYEQIDLIRALSDINIQFLESKYSNADESIATLDKLSGIKNLDIALFHSNVEKRVIDYAHTLGIKVNVWVVDDPTSLEKLLSFGVDYITTNLIIDAKILPEESYEFIEIASKAQIKDYITSQLHLVSNSDFKEDGDNTNTYCYDEENDVYSISSYNTGGIHCKLDCNVGDMIYVEYDYYAIDAFPQLKINGYTFDPEKNGTYKEWKHVSLSIPNRFSQPSNIYIGCVSGKYKLRNIKIQCIKT